MSGDEELLSINDVAALGIQGIRKSVWANPFDHLKIDVFNGRPGPWLHLWCPFNLKCNGRDPVSILLLSNWVDAAHKEFVPYAGPLPNSAEYLEDVARYANFPIENRSREDQT